jgi:transcriptional regulator with XRE-family HTH domain
MRSKVADMSNRVSRQANGPAIRAIRVAKGVSLRTLAQRTGYNRGHLSRVERGHVGTERLAVTVAKALEVAPAAVTQAVAA